MIVPPICSASASARADLPLAVGPARRMGLIGRPARDRPPRGWASHHSLAAFACPGNNQISTGRPSMPFVATLIGPPDRPALDDAILGRAAGILGSSGPVW